MTPVIVDTDVVSFVFKRDTRARLYLPHLAGKTLGISFMTLAELERWVIENHWGPARYARLKAYLHRFTFHGVSPNLCLLWAQIQAKAKEKGRPMDAADAWIAATALLHHCPLMTHNRKDFADVDGLIVISEAP